MTPTPSPGPRRRTAAPATVGGLVAGTLLLLALHGGAPLAAAEVHEEAVLESAASAVAPGAELRLSGRDFAAGEEHRLRLVGALEERDLGEVSPDSAGTFEIAVEIPAEASAGRYQVEAVAPDGDVVARLPVTVVAGSPDSEDRASEGGETGDAGEVPAADREATAEEMEIDHARSALDWTVILLLVGSAGGVGVALLRRSGRHAPPQAETNRRSQQRRTT